MRQKPPARKAFNPTLGKYILKKGKPVLEHDLLIWARWIEEHQKQCRIGFFRAGKMWVSTLFLGVDHNYSNEGSPILWETMISGGKHDGKMWRHTSLAAARAGHRRAVEMVKEELAHVKIITE